MKVHDRVNVDRVKGLRRQRRGVAVDDCSWERESNLAGAVDLIIDYERRQDADAAGHPSRCQRCCCACRTQLSQLIQLPAGRQESGFHWPQAWSHSAVTLTAVSH